MSHMLCMDLHTHTHTQMTPSLPVSLYATTLLVEVLIDGAAESASLLSGSLYPNRCTVWTLQLKYVLLPIECLWAEDLSTHFS